MRLQDLSLTTLLTGRAHSSVLARSTSDSTTSGLKWAPCEIDLGDDVYGNMTEPRDCATLEVPLDYTNYADDRTIKLQLIRVNATKEPVLGSVLYNPGGPGGSGVDSVAKKNGPILRE